ncbi:hypothetical protein TIFTF001_035466 [Ficus carica]|uniref:Receptor-like serine/threonine-protein kinase n=1 Tax=Ficus carica TaxID=3494 RepID=A0AA88J9Q3_FICCA|nr:hypothetical protein TIFTF001_035466 [Ficus carica]
MFEFGFFSPGSSKNRYVGIWYKNITVKTVVWVANRCNPIIDSSGSLTINDTRNLVLLYQNKSVVWSTNSSEQAKKPLVQLLDSGNLVLKDEENTNSEAYLWQSFDYPSDTLLPGMKLGWDLRTGLNRRLSAWRNWEDPCSGDFTWGVEFVVQNQTVPEVRIRKGGENFLRAGPWNGLGFSGFSELRPNSLFDYDFVYNEDEVYCVFNLKSNPVITILVLNQTTDTRQRLTWVEAGKSWKIYYSDPKDHCDKYGLCGGNGNCVIGDNPVCQCLKGFKPKSEEKWYLTDWSEGCTRDKLLNCSDKDRDGFVKFVGLKMPDTAYSHGNRSMNIKECRAKCLSDCSCVAYASADIKQGSGCMTWYGDLIDIRSVPSSGQDLYVRMPASELGKKPKTVENGNQEEDLELPSFDLFTIINATNNFSASNKLGQGGFGPVYRGEEKLLVYEYMPNKGLDSFIFNQNKAKLLQWGKRFQIICGIARGLLYLHQDSRLRIIHRDLKASNVLLDNEMNPKISDFGLAKTFGGDQIEGNTNRVVGTYGYMAPEYVSNGQFSTKSDVFSFGMMVLEIVSGKRSTSFSQQKEDLTLTGHAWTLMQQGMAIELLDSCLRDSDHNLQEVLCCIHVGLLCVQQRAADRPSMSSVVVMLSSDDHVLPCPNRPGYFMETKSRLRPATAPRAGDPCSSSPESRIVGVWPRHSPPFAGKLLGKFRYHELPKVDTRSGFLSSRSSKRCPSLFRLLPVNAGQRRSKSVNAGQRRSKSVNAGQSWSMPVNAGQLSPNFGRSPFRPIFDVPDMFTTSDLRYEISKVKNGD